MVAWSFPGPRGSPRWRRTWPPEIPGAPPSLRGVRPRDSGPDPIDCAPRGLRGFHRPRRSRRPNPRRPPRAGGTVLRKPRHAHQPGHALGDLVEPRTLGPRSGLAKARDAAVDEPGIDLAQGRIVDLEPVLDSGRKFSTKTSASRTSFRRISRALSSRRFRVRLLLLRLAYRK